HFLVIEGIKGDRVYVNDPASGPRRIDMEAFKQGFTGVCLTFEPGPDFQKGGKKRSLVHALGSRLKGSRTVISFIMAASLMLVIPGIVQPTILKVFVDDVLTRGFSGWLLPLVIGLVLSGITTGILTWMQQRYLLLVQTKLAVSLAAQFFWHVLCVPVIFYSQRYVGDVASRVQSCHRLAALLAGPLPTTVIHCIMIVFFGGVMLLFSWQLTLLVFVLTGGNVIALQLAQHRRKDLNNVLLNETAKSQGAAMAGLQAIETLKASGTESEFFSIWSGYQTKTVNTNQRLSEATTLLSGVPGLLDSLLAALVLGGGALLVMHSTLTIGGLVAFQALMVHVTGPIKSLVGFGAQLQEIEGNLNRLDDVLRYPRDPLLADDKQEIDATTLSGHVEIRNVCFGYSPLDPPLIENFDLVLTPGKRVALVGGSGSGKSTLAKLILGVYQPQSGDILFDGMPLTSIPRELTSRSFSSVDQDTALFEGSIADNLAMWDSTVDDDQILRAARDAQIHEVVASRPGGYRSLMAEVGTNFSGGQRQRLEIARALVHDPSILVLDEATSALDPLTEQQIDLALRRRGCTCIIVAHRLSTIRDADEIIVMNKGKAVERGNHDELMQMKGFYAALVGAQ
ncbi:MAG: ATP-binding cassette domain-containing protein, partial [Rhodospirillaceae bacterium]|nr:ATP-binding cassette domain-containing protein [Rhodospirillaceae bacterium]